MDSYNNVDGGVLSKKLDSSAVIECQIYCEGQINLCTHCSPKMLDNLRSAHISGL